MSDDPFQPRLRLVSCFRDTNCDQPAMSPRYGSDKLLSLRYGAAYLSSRFQSDRAELPAEDRAKVNSMIELFFEPGIGTHIPSSSPLRRKMNRFICPLGTIYYFESREHEAPVMQCFELHGPGGGGGFHVGMPVAPTYPGGVSKDDEDCSSGRRIAARFDDLLQQPAAHRFAVHALWMLPGEATSRTAKGRRRARAHLRGDRLLGQIADTCQALCVRPDPASLPSWSLLRKSAYVAEQLENDFARAIFAGEAVSHLGRSLSLFSDEARGLNHWRRRRGELRGTPIDPRILYDETLRVLRAINRRSDQNEWTRCQYFVSLSFVDDDILGDMRYLSILRSEMIFHFSNILQEFNKQEYKDVAFRFAKFAYFTELSRDFFGVSGDDYPIDGLIVECKSKQRPAHWITNELVRNIDEFGHMSASIVEHLLGDTNGERNETTEFEHLCELASQILLDDRTIEVVTFGSSPQAD